MREEEIVRLLLHQPEKGTAAAMERYGQKVKWMVSQVLRNVRPEDVEECVADVFVKLWQDIPAFDENLPAAVFLLFIGEGNRTAARSDGKAGGKPAAQRARKAAEGIDGKGRDSGMRQEEWLDFLEPDAEDLLEAEAFLWPKKKKGKLPKKKWMVLFAACLLFAALSTAVLAAKKTGGDGLLSWFQVADDRKETIFEQLQLEPGMSAEDAGYTILVTDVASDGQDVYIMLDLTAPEGTELGNVYGLDFRPGLLSGGSQDADTADFLRGGWYAEVLAQPEPNRVTMLISVSPSTRVDGKKLLLSIRGIREMADGEDRVLAKGEWELVLKISAYKPKRIRQ